MAARWNLPFQDQKLKLLVFHVICSTHESYPQYPWGYAVPVREVSFILHSYKFTHGYWGYDSQVLRIWLTGTEDMTHGYWGYDSRVLHTLTGTDDMTHGYCISSRVLRIWLRGNEYLHGYWWYDSRVMHILTGTAYSLYRVRNEPIKTFKTLSVT